MFKPLMIVMLLFPALAVGQEVDKSVAEALGLVPASSESAFKRIPLALGSSTEIVFPVAGKLRLKPRQAADLEIINANNRLIITPKKAISGEQTVVFVLSDTQQTVLLKLFMVEQKDHKPVIRIGEQRVGATPNGRFQPKASKSEIFVPGPRNESGSYLDEFKLMAAFAARSAYSPDRLLSPPKGLKEVNPEVGRKKLSRLTRIHNVRADVLSSWSYKDWFVTVVQLTNTSTSEISLSPEVVRGRFLAKSFHRDFIGVSETNKYTAVYLISDTAFANTLEDL